MLARTEQPKFLRQIAESIRSVTFKHVEPATCMDLHRIANELEVFANQLELEARSECG